VPDLGEVLRRLVLGRPSRAWQLGTPGGKPIRVRWALPMLAPDALSSVAYAPDEILLMLGAGGLSALAAGPWVGLAIVGLMAVVIASYRQTIKAYPQGGDYQVARANLGPIAGVTVGGAMMVDALLTVAVSVSAGAHYLAAVFPSLDSHVRALAMGLVLVLTFAALRGARVIAPLAIAAVYLFTGVLGVTALVGVVRWLSGNLPAVDPVSALVSQPETALTALAWAGLAMRAFASGAVALTGVQSVVQGAAIFREPKQKNASRSLAFLGVICSGMLLVVLVLAWHLGVASGEAEPVLAQILRSVFSGVYFLFAAGTVVVAALLVVAAGSAFRWVPGLMSMLAHDAYLPKQFYRRGDRRVTAHGIITLSVGSLALIWLFNASVSRLIYLYIIGVFTSFTLSQLGMIRHWNGQLRLTKTAVERRRMVLARVVSSVGFVATTATLVIVVITKFTHGAWLSLGLVVAAVTMMAGVHRHYVRVADELVPPQGDPRVNALPSRVHAIVLVSVVSKATARAIAYARATRPATLEALTVGIDQRRLRQLRNDWEQADLPVKLRVMNAPTGELTRPVIDYITEARRRAPRDLVVLYLPEKVVRHWWERLLHNRSAARLTARLKNVPGVVIASVPWQLERNDE